MAKRTSRVEAELSEAAAALGRRGGASRSDAKTKAARENGRLGGRPPVQYIGLLDREKHEIQAPDYRRVKMRSIRRAQFPVPPETWDDVFFLGVFEREAGGVMVKVVPMGTRLPKGLFK
jgi:hypothetical protein